ncbi:MAG TPA: hypothetical protein ENI06_11510 [Spirochaetales bacterium]|nr:hypothetical protein [Spirochaetales bacterium]
MSAEALGHILKSPAALKVIHAQTNGIDSDKFSPHSLQVWGISYWDFHHRRIKNGLCLPTGERCSKDAFQPTLTEPT